MHRDRGKKEFGCEAIWKRSRVESRARTTQTPQAIRSRAFVSGQLRERERVEEFNIATAAVFSSSKQSAPA